MLNLSDKELDRLSREAANQHDPGDLTGPRSWERLAPRLDKELGRIGPSPLRGFRRIPFYYAPVILLLVGVSYYFVRQNRNPITKTEPSGSPPLTVVKSLPPGRDSIDLSPKMSENSLNSTSKSSKSDSEHSTGYPAASEVGSSRSAVTPEAGSGMDHSATTRSNGSPVTTPHPGAGESTITAGPDASSLTTAHSAIRRSTITTRPGAAAVTIHHPKIPASASRAAGSALTLAPDPGTSENSVSAHNSSTGSKSRSAFPPGSTASQRGSGFPGSTRSQQSIASHGSTGPSGSAASRKPSIPGSTVSQGPPLLSSSPVNASLRNPEFSVVQAPRPLARAGTVDDSALRAFAVNGASTATPIRIDKKKETSLHISRPLEFGFSLSPDFASVHSLAGDRPGSSIGITMDYQFLNRLYLSTGLLITRKNFASNPGDYHVPDSYYRINNVHNVSLIKGTFYMLEIPLNLRYDFHLSGNTVFFVSGGVSSFLMTSEHSQYYFDQLGRPECLNFSKEVLGKRKNYLFSSINLSMGVKTGLSNSVSLLIAPYVKVPTRGMGYGQVQITSVGLNFSLRYAPVLSRKRK